MKNKPNKKLMVLISRMKCIYDFSDNSISLDELYSYVINLIKKKS